MPSFLAAARTLEGSAGSTHAAFPVAGCIYLYVYIHGQSNNDDNDLSD